MAVEVAREIDHPNPHVLLLKIERDIQRIHENDLEIGGDLLDFNAQPPVKLIDIGADWYNVVTTESCMSGDYFLDGGLAFDQFKSRRVEIDSP